MRRLYYLIRGVAYTCGVAAVMLILWGRRTDLAFAPELLQTGILLMIVTMVLFGVSYVLFGILRRRKTKGGRPSFMKYN